MKVWVIEHSSDGYEKMVVGVAASPEAARAFVKRDSCAVSWSDRPLGTIGHYEFILGKCTKHDGDYSFYEYELQDFSARCQFCSEWFNAGVGTGRRGDAKFCSKEHQVLFNSRKRSKGNENVQGT